MMKNLINHIGILALVALGILTKGCSSTLATQQSCHSDYYMYTLTNNVGCPKEGLSNGFSAAIGYYNESGVFVSITNIDVTCESKVATALVPGSNVYMPEKLTIRVKDDSRDCFSNEIIREFTNSPCNDSYEFRLNQSSSGEAYLKGAGLINEKN